VKHFTFALDAPNDAEFISAPSDKVMDETGATFAAFGDNIALSGHGTRRFSSGKLRPENTGASP